MPNFVTLERDINDLLELATAQLTPIERAEVQGFLKVGEYGLALETFTDIIIEEEKQINIAILNKCNEIARQMEMTPEACEKMRSLVI